MIKLPAEKLKEFVSISSYIGIDKNEVNLMYNYIRINIEFGTCTMSITNGRTFCQFSFETDSDDITFLVERKPFVDFLSNSSRDFVTISADAKNVHMTDGYKKSRYNSMGYNHEEFPTIPNFNQEESKLLERNVLDAVYLASFYAGTDTVMPSLTAVYLDDKKVFASNQQKFYIRKFDDDLPPLAMSIQECTVVSKYTTAEYCVVGNINIYKCGRITYGFARADGLKPFDCNFLLDKMTKENYITFNKEHIVNFCLSTISFMKEEAIVTNSSMNVSDDGTIQFIYLQKEKNEENEIVVQGKQTGKGFTVIFNPMDLLPVLKSLPYEEISLSDEKSAYSIWSNNDEKYIGVFSKRTL